MIIRIVLLIAGLLVAAAGSASAQDGRATLNRAGWMAGCWEGTSGSDHVEERWSPARGGTMVGTGRTFRGDSTASVEMAILRPRGDTLRYEAHPVGQEPTVFSGTGTRGDSIVFENPLHDFPQRIIYRRVGADSLHARVEGPSDGRLRGVDYRMARVPCFP